MNGDIHRLCANMALGTFNGIYQGLLITGIIAGLLRLLVRTNAATRHAVWFGGLILVVLLIPAHCWLDSHLDPNYSGQAEVQPNNFTQLAHPPAYSIPAATRPSAGVSLTHQGMSENNFIIPGLGVPADETLPSEPEEININQMPTLGSVTLASSLESDEDPASEMDEQPSVGIFPQSRRGDGFRSKFARLLRPASWNIEPNLGLPFLLPLLFFWFVGTVIHLVLLSFRIHQLRKLTEESSAAEGALKQLFEEAKRTAGVARKVELRLSHRHRCPVVLGFLRPAILLPVELTSELEETRQVLCHELAHVRRYDDWANLFQHFAMALLFFHPAVWWIGRRLSLEREIACDDHVLQQGIGRRKYALVLANVAHRITQQAPLLAPGVSNNHSQLQQRIGMILNTRRNSSSCLAKGRMTTVIAATALLAVLALYSAPRMVFAGSDSGEPTPQNASETAGAAVSGPASTPAVLAGSAGSGSAAAVASESSGEAAPAVEPGPKFKPETPGGEPAEPVEIAAPEAPLAPNLNMDFVPRPPRAARAGRAGKVPRPPESPDDMNQQDGSIDERLRRLEKMVRSLMEQQGVKQRGMVYSQNGYDMNADRYQQKIEKMRGLAEAGNDKVSEQKFKELAERQAARTADQVKRATEQAKRATRDLEARIEQDQMDKGEFRDGVQRQLESLRKARESLSQEMDKLSRQIEKLERAQQRGENDQKRRSEADSEKLQADNNSEAEIVR